MKYKYVVLFVHYYLSINNSVTLFPVYPITNPYIVEINMIFFIFFPLTSNIIQQMVDINAVVIPQDNVSKINSNIRHLIFLYLNCLF